VNDSVKVHLRARTLLRPRLSPAASQVRGGPIEGTGKEVTNSPDGTTDRVQFRRVLHRGVIQVNFGIRMDSEEHLALQALSTCPCGGGTA
jgi:hypothetical protein